jgi:uncharacterized protein YndB with AHSA1/START domain
MRDERRGAVVRLRSAEYWAQASQRGYREVTPPERLVYTSRLRELSDSSFRLMPTLQSTRNSEEPHFNSR